MRSFDGIRRSDYFGGEPIGRAGGGRSAKDLEGVFRSGRGCVDQIFKLKQIGEKARKKERRIYVGFIDL